MTHRRPARRRRAPTPPTADPALPIAERVADLLARMTVEEKVAQLGSAWVFQLADGPGLDAARAAELLRHGSARSRGSPGRAAWRRATRPSLANAIQRHLVERDPPGHPGDRPRGDLLGVDGPRFDDLPAGDRRSPAPGSPSSPPPSPTPYASRCGRWAPTRASRRCSTSAATRAGGVPRRRSARTRTSSPAWVSRSCAACRATTSPTA